MKKLSSIDKLMFVLNSILAAILLVSYLSYYVSPKSISLFSFLSLSVPFLILLNVAFAVYWLFQLKRQFFVSAIVLLIGFSFLTRFYSVYEKKVLLSDDIKIMSYNVRLFNVYNWIDNKNTATNIYSFIRDKNPDILCVQEFHSSKDIGFKYPYSYVKIAANNNNFGHAIFSKYKIINSGSLNFSNSGNNAIYADLLIREDTVRVYNVHLESLKIKPSKDPMEQEISEKFRERVQKAFVKQTDQVDLLINHMEGLSMKSVLCGDFNNNAFSWAYHKLKSDKNDTFEIAGKGFGKTYDYFFPLRIDFILSDQRFDVNNFKTFPVLYSDHFPIMARLNF